MERDINSYYNKFTDEQLNLLEEYLLKRYTDKANKCVFGIVFDILHRCNLHCRGCGTNARFTPDKVIFDPKPTFQEIDVIFKKIKAYSDSTEQPVFINIGGGEPFLRHDIIKVLALASKYFGAKGVGIDTNGSLDNSFELITSALPYVSYIGISINGLEKYHNWWSGTSKINAFEKSMSAIEKLCKTPEAKEKLEITSIATKKNLNELPSLMIILDKLGVKNYSVHRAIPVGRMANCLHLIPDANEYLTLLINILEKSAQTGLNVHLHHSIDSIHATLFLDLKTYVPDKIGNPDAGSSLGIEPEGALVFDPWCTTGIWKTLSSGNLLTEEIGFSDLLDKKSGSVLDLARIYTAPHLRCKGCTRECSGGSRIVAAAQVLNNINSVDVTDSHILDAMTSIDPACPLYSMNNDSNQVNEK